MYRINQLARQFGLSRSTLLYYDRIGLLVPSGRTDSGYRVYSSENRDRLESICSYREAGLSIDEIRSLLSREGDETLSILQNRFSKLGEEVRSLRLKQRVLGGMLSAYASGTVAGMVDREMWVDMLRATGMDDDAMQRWHAEFEQRAPESHHDFLLSLGIPETEALRIRKWSQRN